MPCVIYLWQFKERSVLLICMDFVTSQRFLPNSIELFFLHNYSQTPHYYGQFALSLGKESPYIFSKFNLLNTDTPLKRPLSMAPSVPVLKIGLYWERNVEV